MENRKIRITLNEEKKELYAILKKTNFRVDKSFLCNCILLAYNNGTLFNYYECNNEIVCLFRGDNIQDVKESLANQI